LSCSSRTWKKQFENRAAHARSLDTHFTAVVLHDLLNDRKSKSDSFFFPVADERLKQIFEDWLWNSGAIIGHANLDAILGALAAHVNPSGMPRNSFARVEQKIQHDALQFLWIKPSNTLLLM